MVLRDVRRLIEQIVAVRPPTNQQVNQSGDQTLKTPGVRPGQPPVPKPADDPRNRDNKSFSQDQGRMTGSRAASLQFPTSATATKQDEPNVVRQGEVSTVSRQQTVSPAPRQPVSQKTEKKCKSKSTCGSSYYDIPLISSLG